MYSIVSFSVFALKTKWQHFEQPTVVTPNKATEIFWETGPNKARPCLFVNFPIWSQIRQVFARNKTFWVKIKLFSNESKFFTAQFVLLELKFKTLNSFYWQSTEILVNFANFSVLNRPKYRNRSNSVIFIKKSTTLLTLIKDRKI